VIQDFGKWKSEYWYWRFLLLKLIFKVPLVEYISLGSLDEEDDTAVVDGLGFGVYVESDLYTRC